MIDRQSMEEDDEQALTNEIEILSGVFHFDLTFD
jgi:hypothetical protein